MKNQDGNCRTIRKQYFKKSPAEILKKIMEIVKKTILVQHAEQNSHLKDKQRMRNEIQNYNKKKMNQ